MYNGNITLVNITLFITLVVIVNSSEIQEICEQKVMKMEMKHENCISSVVEIGYCAGYCMSIMSFAPEVKNYTRGCIPVSHRVKSRIKLLECYGTNIASMTVSKKYQYIEECRCQDTFV